MRLRWLIAALVLCAALAAFNQYALDNFLYWRYRWFDIPMHILGGLATGAFLIAVIGRHRPRLYLGLMVAVAVGWEVFEYAFGLTSHEPGYAFDTFHDLVDDALGALIAYAAARYTLWRSA